MNPKLSIPVIDLHCDLLLYLQRDPNRTPLDLQSRCALPQHQAGGVKLQVMAHFTTTGEESVRRGAAQLACYQKILQKYAEHYEALTSRWQLESLFEQPKIRLLWAVENASLFWLEHEPFSQGMERLELAIRQQERPLYIGLTWNEENRFGGGVHSKTGLKPDGCKLLDYLDARGIAVDLSHASDELAGELLSYIDRRQLQIPVMASHSNFRQAADVPRNMPDCLVRELLEHRGLIGLNFIRSFVGPQGIDSFLRHVAHGLTMRAHEHLSFGADFFYEPDLPPESQRHGPFFSEDLKDASVYPALLGVMQQKLKLPEAQLRKIANGNALAFLHRHYFAQLPR